MSTAGKILHGVRFAAIGSVSTGLGLFNREWGREYLVRELSRMPGLPAKVSQILQLKYGQAGWGASAGRAMPIEWVKAQILEELPSLAAEIEEISEDGITASLGQVHCARLKSGREVAVKVQFPNVARQVDEQLELLLSSMDLVPAGRKYGLDVEHYRGFLREFFRKEVDYRHEAESQIRFRHAWAPLGGVLVPEVLTEFSNPRILVQSFERSLWLDSLMGETEEVRSKVAAALAREVLVGTLRLGLVHTDLHQRNWGFRNETDQLVLYDYGATLLLDAELRRHLHALFFSNDDSPSGCLGRFEELGFDVAKLSNISQQLPELLDLIVEPFHHDGPWQPSSWKLTERIDALLGGDRWWFRVAGPPWFLFLMRGFFGAVESMARLNVGVDFGRILKDEVGIKAMPAAPLPSPQRPEKAALSARVLRVRVTEGSNVIVDLTLPARAVEDLEELVPDHVLLRLREEGIEVVKLKQQALASGLIPQELFQTRQGAREYRVWLSA